MTKMMKRLEAERRRSWRAFRMGGLVTRRHVFAVAREFGWRKALRVLFTTERTALSILMA